MDTFQTSVGYRSLFPSCCTPEKQALQQLSEKELLQLAKDSFDASIAEILRSTGEWHWKLEIRDVAENRAEELSAGSHDIYEFLRTAILSYYGDHYRMPSEQEYSTYITEHHPSLLEPRVTASCYSDDHMVEVKQFNATLWFTQATDEELQALRDEEYGGDYTADSVAEFIAPLDQKVQAIFDHNATLPRSVELRGFECHVNEEEAEVWIAKHRPHLIPKEEGSVKYARKPNR